MNKNIKKAVEIIKQGGIVIFPTDTAFGIGCRIDNKDAVKRLFVIRKRPLRQAMPVLVSSLEMAKKYSRQIPSRVIENLIKPYWPGALTIVLESNNEKVLKILRGGGDTIGLRMPDEKTILEIIEKVGVPILGSSANFHGESTPFSFKDLSPDLISLADFILEGECKLKQASTVIDVTKLRWKILRRGALNITIDL